MTPDEQDRLARARFAMLSAMRAGGVVTMLLGMWIWWGDVIRTGGYPLVGLPLFVIGFFNSLILPQIFARRWRSPRP
ncbi:MAG: hypothetical protein JWM75_2475 [Sphingomonas bacterium]|jgi:hypothetical protein|nr:hypothetical protein [Sphingomonas bacterium]